MSTSRNLAELVAATAAGRPDAPALRAGERRVTWAELEDAAARVARALRARGLEPGDRVALLLGNSVEFVMAYTGVLRAGLVAVPVSSALTPREVAGVVADSGARAVVSGRAGWTTLGGIDGARPELVVVVDEGAPPAGAVGWGALLDEGGDAPEPGAAAGGEDLAALLYTSGTSGRPRAAMLTHRALLANVEQVLAQDPAPVLPDDVVLAVVPFAHVFGLNGVLGPVLRTGACAVLVERFDPVETLRTAERAGVTVVPGAPPMWLAWSMLPDAAGFLAGLRLAVSGSAALPPETWEALRRGSGLEVREGYGLTEAAPVVTSSVLSPRVKAGSVGRPLPGVEVRLVDPDGSPVKDGDPGQLLVRGANLFSGYWPDGTGGPDGEGWYATGDLAYADDDGDLHVVGRAKELVIVSGFNVYPLEVEEVLLLHPGVAEAAVVPVPHPFTGEAVKAYLVPEPGVELDPDEVVAHCARRLARFKCPTVVAVVDELPHSLTGKVAKGRLPESAGADAAEVAG